MSIHTFRRSAFLFLLLSLTPFGGLAVMFKWYGDRGDPTTSRLYVPLRGESGGALVSGDPVPGKPLCYAVHDVAVSGKQQEVCYEKPLRLRLKEGATVLIAVGSTGAPSVSVVGGDFATDDWIGSNASLTGQNPRIPLRSYGAPGKAAQVVTCTQPLLAAATTDSVWCIRVVDRLRRLAIVNAQGAVRRLGVDSTYLLQAGDQFWMGLAPYDVGAAAETPTARPTLQLTLRTRHDPDGADGDRRWLGRMMPIDLVDSDTARPANAPREAFAVYPMHVRYTLRNLSRQRTDFEAEDLVQRMVDAELLCLNAPDSRVVWRTVGSPGCITRYAVPDTSSTRLQADYDLARVGFLAPLVSRLVERTNALISTRDYLRDPSRLALDFDWEMRELPHTIGVAVGESPMQPAPRELWGVHHGATRASLDPRVIHSSAKTVSFSGGTSTVMVDVLQRGRKLVEFAAQNPRGKAVGTLLGAVCVGGAVANGVAPISRTALLGVGGVHANGALTWAADQAARCASGCRIELQAHDMTGRTLQFQSGTGCRIPPRKLSMKGKLNVLDVGDSLETGIANMVLRFRFRGEQPLAAWKPAGNPSWSAAGEFVDSALVGPLLGLPAAQSGILAAVNDYQSERGGADSEASQALTIDGDLQKILARIVREAIATRVGKFAGAKETSRRVSAVVMDGENGAVLASVSAGADAVSPTFFRNTPSAWELASEQAKGSENTAFVRRGPIGSTMKVATLYALSNDPAVGHGPLDGAGTVTEGPGKGVGGAIYLARYGNPNIRNPRQCLGRHQLPRTSAAVTHELIAQNFAKSCNGFFSIAGIMYASGQPASLSAAPAADDSLGIKIVQKRDSAIFVMSDKPSIGDRIRRGIAADVDAGDDHVPHSLYGVLLRLGFSPMIDLDPGERTVRIRAAHEYAFDLNTRRMPVTLHDDWFAGTGNGPALASGRDFNYPTVPSASRFGGQAVAPEYADALTVPITGQSDANPSVDLALLLIGQGEVEASALTLAIMYSPMARVDGRVIKPCLIQAMCHNAMGARVVPDATTLAVDAPVASAALRQVLRNGTASRAIMSHSNARTQLQSWGGKTGTYDREPTAWPASRGDEGAWERLVAHACGVRLLALPDVSTLAQYLSKVRSPHEAYVRSLMSSPAGVAAGAKACVGTRALNPSGVHRNASKADAARLDDVVDWLEGTKVPTPERNHAMVLVSLPKRGAAEPAASRSQGLIVAVLEDADADIAKSIGIRMALAIEQWASIRRP